MEPPPSVPVLNVMFAIFVYSGCEFKTPIYIAVVVFKHRLEFSAE
ncbi:hypothetical protein HMPREF9554_01240 [Treponema phagedenis F0421]|nr:hypothetical protein HMPREF9554_01240 [Treponema phagedenis F0421]